MYRKNYLGPVYGDTMLSCEHQHAPGESAHLLNLFVSEQMKPATSQSHHKMMLHTLKPHRHKQEKRPKRNKLTWIRVFTRLDKHTLEVSFVVEIFELLDLSYTLSIILVMFYFSVWF